MIDIKGMTYASSGVDYGGGLDQFKVDAQKLGEQTVQYLEYHGFKDVPWTHGESIHLIEHPDGYLGVMTEGLGTKSKVADEMYYLHQKVSRINQKDYHKQVAQCAMAMIVNDAITLGAMPVEVSMYLALGHSEWFKDRVRYMGLLEGWVRACHLARCNYGSGETPVLKGVIDSETFDLAGAAICIVKPKSNLIKANIQHRDAIVMIASNGIHANGLTLARQIAERKDPIWKKVLNNVSSKRFPMQELPDGYLTLMSDGRTYGDALLDPTQIYVQFVADCLRANVAIHYAVNITGHGWRKLMRAVGDFSYSIHTLPEQLPIFDFIQKHGPVNDYEMYSTFNMGAGFAVYVPYQEVKQVIQLAQKNGLKAHYAGDISKGKKQVRVAPKNIVFKAETMNIR